MSDLPIDQPAPAPVPPVPPAPPAPPAPVEWPQEIYDRTQRVWEYHQASKLTHDLFHALPAPNRSCAPELFLTFSSLPKIPLPTILDAADVPATSLLALGRDALLDTQLDAPRDLRTLATWLFLSNGLTDKYRFGSYQTWLRTVPSLGGSYPCEIYVAAFGIEGLDPGLYHYSPREFALRKMRDGLEVLAMLKRGRPDLQFLKNSPAALLVSTIFSRATWLFGDRGYRTALTDAGRLVENIVLTGTAVGLEVSARLMLNDSMTRELIGVPQDVPFEQAESVQAMVVWTDANAAAHPLPTGHTPMPPIPRPTRTDEEMQRRALLPVIAHEAIRSVQQDCVAPGVALREIRPPLTEISPLGDDVVYAERHMVQPTTGGKPLGKMLMKRRPIRAFQRRPIPRDDFLAINTIAFRGRNYYPLMPDSQHAALIRPVWIVLDVSGMEKGIWYYHPPTDQWSMVTRGRYRDDASFFSCESNLAGDASAICCMMSDMRSALLGVGPDSYRLAHLEAGILAQRMQVAAEAADLGAVCNSNFYDDDLRIFLAIPQEGWEIVQQVCVGAPLTEASPQLPESVLNIPEDEFLG